MHDPADRSGSALGDYVLERLLGRGAMGEVYQATDRRRGRTVALKLLAPQFAGDVMFRERFLRESRMAAQLNDPHVIPIHDWGEINGYLFLDMRIVEGGNDLRKLLQVSAPSGTSLPAAIPPTAPLTPERAVSIIEQVAQALDAAHAAGLVHRDVKPDNILIDGTDFAYLVDFGLAQTTTDPRLTETGAAVGSFAYMAPERFGAGNIATPATDIYALTCVLVECLTGTAPFGAGDLQVLVAAHLNQPPPMLGSPFDAVIACGMAKNPADRFTTAGEMAAAARQALATRTGINQISHPITTEPSAYTTATGYPVPPSPGPSMPPATAIPPIVAVPPVQPNTPPAPVAPSVTHQSAPTTPATGYPGSHQASQDQIKQDTARNAVIHGAIVFVVIVVIVVTLLVATLA